MCCTQKSSSPPTDKPNHKLKLHSQCNIIEGFRHENAPLGKVERPKTGSGTALCLPKPSSRKPYLLKPTAREKGRCSFPAFLWLLNAFVVSYRCFLTLSLYMSSIYIIASIFNETHPFLISMTFVEVLRTSIVVSSDNPFAQIFIVSEPCATVILLPCLTISILHYFLYLFNHDVIYSQTVHKGLCRCFISLPSPFSYHSHTPISNGR